MSHEGYVAAACLAAALALAACGTPSVKSTATASTLVDPMVQVSDVNSDYYADSVAPLVHEKFTGPQHLTIKRTTGLRQILYYVACTPDSDFAVWSTSPLPSGSAFSTGCTNTIGNSGQIPVPTGTAPIKVTVQIPDNVTYWLVALPVA